MSRRIFNIVRPREYTAGTGEVKTAWDRHGVLIVDGKKLSIHLDSIPTGDWNGWFNVFERTDDQPGQGNGQGYQQRQAAPPPPAQDFEDDIPF
jgi:hypothetical protein